MNSDNQGQNGQSPEWIPLSEAAQFTPYSADYLSLLARKRRLTAKKIDGIWYTTRSIITNYLSQQAKRAEALNQSADNYLPFISGTENSIPQDLPEAPETNVRYSRTYSEDFQKIHGIISESAAPVESTENKPNVVSETSSVNLPPVLVPRTEEKPVAPVASTARTTEAVPVVAMVNDIENISVPTRDIASPVSRVVEAPRAVTPKVTEPLNDKSLSGDVLMEEFMRRFNAQIDRQVDSQHGLLFKLGRFIRRSYGYTLRSPRRLPLFIVCLLLVVILPFRFVSGFADSFFTETMYAVKNAQTVMGFRPGTHENEILLLGPEGEIAIFGNVETEGQFRSYVEDGIAPITVKSTTKVENLNADMLDGIRGHEFTLAYVTKNGNVTQEPVFLEGTVEVGQTLLVKGATKLLNSLEVDGNLSVFGEANFSKGISVSGPAVFKDILTAPSVIVSGLLRAHKLIVEGESIFESSVTIKDDLDVEGGVTASSGRISGTFRVQDTFHADADVSLGSDGYVVRVTSEDWSVDNDGNADFTDVSGDDATFSSLTVGGNLSAGSFSATDANATSTFVGTLSLSAALADATGSAGTSGYILQSTGTSTLWVATSSLGIVGGGGGGGITSLNGETGTSQTFATGTATGIGLTITSTGSVHTFTPTVSADYSIPLTASTTDWSTAYSWGDHSLMGYLTATSIDTSTELAAILTDETGTGSVVFSDSPTLTGNTTLANASTTNLSVSGNSYLGSIASGIWNGSTIGVQYGGSGATSLTGILVGNGTSPFTATTTISSSYIEDAYVRHIGDTMTGNLIMGGTAANIALGSNWLSGDGDDEGVFVGALGQVGIGTSSPAFMLDVVQANNTYGIRTGDGVTEAVIGISNTNTGLFGTRSTHATQFVTDNTVRATILSGGNFGIGDTTPASLFTVGAGDAFQVDTSGVVVSGTWNGNDIDISDYTNLSVGNGVTLTDDTLTVVATGGLLSQSGGLTTTGVLEDLHTLGPATTDGEFIVATGAGVFAYESGATVRASLGLGSLATLSTINNDNWSGTDLAVANGGTGTSSLTGLVIGNGASAMTATTTSAGLASVLTDETGTGSAVFSASPTFTGTAAFANLTATNATSTDLAVTSDLSLNLLDGCLELAGGVVTSVGSNCGTGSGGITSLNGLTASSQSFATSSTDGIELTVTSSGGVHTFTTGLASGYEIPASASTTAWNTFYNTPSTQITAGTNIDWTGNTLNVDTDLVNYNNATTAFIDLTDLSSVATGLTYNNTNGQLSFTSGYSIPLTASSTNWNDFYNTPSAQITAGDGLSWSSNTINLDINELTNETTFESGDYLAFYDATAGIVRKLNYDNLPGAGGGLTSLNGLTNAAQTFATSSASGLTLTITSVGSVHTFAPGLAAGYSLPLTASTTEWTNFYNTPSAQITAGDGLSWSSNTINLDINELTTEPTFESGDYLAFYDATAGAVRKVTYDNLPGSGGSLTSLNGLTAATQTFATSSDTNIGLNIVSSGSTHTFTPTWTGTLSVPRGGTGAASLTGLVIGNGTSAMTATTTSAGLASIISDETGTGALVFGTSPTIASPTFSGTIASGLTADRFVTTDASGNLAVSGASANLIASLTDETGTGSAVFSASPTFTGVAAFADLTAANATTTTFTTANFLCTDCLNTDQISDIYVLNTGDTISGNISIGTTTSVARLTVQSTGSADILNLHETGGVEVMTVLENGNVGIGDTSPASLFTVGTADAFQVNSSGQIVAGEWMGNTIDLSTYVNLAVGATGLTLNDDTIDLTAGYNIPLTASTTAWDTFYSTPSTQITAGDGIDWSGNTLNVLTDLGFFTCTDCLNETEIEDIYVLNAGDTMTGNLVMGGTAANIALGSNWLSGDGDDEGVFVDGSGNVGIGDNTPISLFEVQGGLTTSGAIVTLGTEETTVIANDVLGRVNFYAPLEADGSDSILTAASVVAVAEGTFDAASNATSLQFQTGASELATTKMTILSSGNVGIGDTTPASLLTVGSGDAFQVNASGVVVAGSWNGTDVDISDYTNLSVSNGITLTGDVLSVTAAGGLAQTTGGLTTTGVLEDLNTLGPASADGEFIVATGAGTFAYESGATARTSLGLVAGGTGDIWVEKAGDTMTGALTMSGTSANVILGSNFLSGDGGDEGIFVDGSGNVGIGDSTPAGRLEVRDDGTFTSEEALLMLSYTGSGGVRAMTITSPTVDGANEPWNFTTGNAFNFRVDATDALTIGATGNVGIGTTTPGAKLHVASTGDILQLGRTSSTLTGRIQFTDDAAGTTLGYLGFSTNTGSGLVTGGTANSLVLRAESADTFITGGATPIATFKSSGNVGIGTVSPSAKLEVAGANAANFSGIVINNNNNTLAAAESMSLDFTKKYVDPATGTSYTQGRITSSNEVNGNYLNGYLSLSTMRANTVTEAMRITSGGNVGIGDTTPAAMLTVGSGDLFQVNSSGAIAAVVGITTSGDIDLGSGTIIDFADTAADKIHLYTNTYGIGIEGSTLTNWAAIQFRWRTSGTSATTGTERMLLTTTGLDVTGTIDSSGAITEAGSAVLSAANIDTCAEFIALVVSTGTCGSAVFSVSPTFTGITQTATLNMASGVLHQTQGASFNVYIQGSAPGTGGGDVRNLALIGNEAADDLILNYNTEYDCVSIGGTSCTEALTVTGAISATGDLSITGGGQTGTQSGVADGIYVNPNTDGAEIAIETNSGIEGGILSLDSTGLVYMGAWSNNDLILRTNNANRMTISAAGAISMVSTLAVTGDITEAGSAVLSAANIDTCAEFIALVVSTGTCGSSVFSVSPTLSGTVTIASNLDTAGSVGTYGSLTIDGSKGGYSGFQFEDVTGDGSYLMVHNTADIQGFYNAGWSWYFQAGVLTAGSVPAARITAGTLTGAYSITSTLAVTGAITEAGSAVLSAANIDTCAEFIALVVSTGTCGSAVFSVSPTITGTLTAGTANFGGAVTMASTLTGPTAFYLESGASRVISIATQGPGAAGNHLFIRGGAGGSGGGVPGNVYIGGGAPGGVGDIGDVILGHSGAAATGNVGIRSAPTGGTLHVGGTLYVLTNTAVGADPLCWDGAAGSVYGDCSSLGKWKTNVEDYDAGLEEILAIEAVTFDWKRNEDGSLTESEDASVLDPDTGFIAEQVASVSYNFGRYDKTTGALRDVNERGIMGAMVNAIKETHLSLEELLMTGSSTQTENLAAISDPESNSIWSRMVTLAESFVDGVLKIASAEIEYVKAGKVETNELCVGSVCVDEGTFLQMVESSGGTVSAMEHEPEPTPEPTPEEETEPEPEEVLPNEDPEPTPEPTPEQEPESVEPVVEEETTEEEPATDTVVTDTSEAGV